MLGLKLNHVSKRGPVQYQAMPRNNPDLPSIGPAEFSLASVGMPCYSVSKNEMILKKNFFSYSPASREMLDRRWANVVTYVGATSANDVGPTWICPSVQRWHNFATPPTMTLCQRFANVITYCNVIFDGWYYVCTLFIPVNMP